MRVMYDSIDASLIPPDAEMVAGYVNGRYAWSARDWARFSHVPRLRIDVNGTQPWLSDIADCERGDLTPGGAADWCLKRERTHGWWSAVYCDLSNWPAVQAACRAVGASKVCWWLAEWDEKAALIPGAVAKQYSNSIHYDMSVVEPGWFKTSAPGWSVP